MKNKQRVLACLCAAGLLTGSDLAGESVPLDAFTVHGDLEVTLWAESPMLFNPTNMDIDRDGRIWVAEGVNYRSHGNRKPEGDRIVVLEDTDGDGKADVSSVFVQEPELRAPLGVAVIDNKIVVSMSPDMIIYTDVNRDRKFDPAVDTREILLTGFNGNQHDHSLHSVTVGPDGQWYWNAGNAGALFTDRSGTTYRIGSSYHPGNNLGVTWDPTEIAGQASDDGYVYVGGFSARMNPDGTGVRIIGHNYRNSYEHIMTSFGDLFQNDNDDPPAARTGYVLEFGNAGFSSADGQRGWGADRRPGQSTPVAQWRQEDPGTMPPGDVYGGGAPTGIAFYENGALGDDLRGLLLSCEAGRNVVFGYLPRPDGAGFTLERFNFLTTNEEESFAGTDFRGGGTANPELTRTMFRPSDVSVGPDGAIYVTDWYDARVGGHQDLDDTLSGAIYRVAPKNFVPSVPQFDLATTEGQVTALKSPAINVRSLGRSALKEQGEAAVPAVAALLNDDNEYIRARAVWLLSQLGGSGITEVEKQLASDDEMTRIVAFRALRRIGHRFLEVALELAQDPSAAVRREVAVAMRDVPFDDARNVLIEVAQRYDGEDRTYLEALGTGATGKEEEIFLLVGQLMGSGNALEWSKAFTRIAWRLSSPLTVDGFKARALSDALSVADRKEALTALAFIGTQQAADAVLEVAGNANGAVKAEAMWWLLNRKDSLWQNFGLNAAMKERGVYDPETVQLIPVLLPPAPEESTMSSLEEILALTGDAEKGRTVSVSCHICHRIGNEGIDYGPDLTDIGKTQPREVLINSIINPSSDISLGFNGTEIQTTDGVTIHGRVLSTGDPLIIQSMGGITQMVPRDRIDSERGQGRGGFNRGRGRGRDGTPLNRSLMMTAEQLGLSPQDVADVVAYLKSM